MDKQFFGYGWIWISKPSIESIASGYLQRGLIVTQTSLSDKSFRIIHCDHCGFNLLEEAVNSTNLIQRKMTRYKTEAWGILAW